MILLAFRCPSAVLLGLVLLSSTGCGPKFAGAYDGEASLKVGGKQPFDGDKIPVRIAVGAGGKSFTITGGPFENCSPRVEEASSGRKAMMLDFKGGSCRITSTAGSIALADGMGIAGWEGDDWTLDYHPPAANQPPTSLVIHAHRTK